MCKPGTPTAERPLGWGGSAVSLVVPVDRPVRRSRVSSRAPYDDPVRIDRRTRAERETWTAYAYLSTFGFLLYGLGSLTPYLRDQLRLTDAQAALHATAVALGTVSAGVFADRVERRLGRVKAGRLASGLVAAASALLAIAPTLPLTLLAAFMLGAGGGAILATVNLVLGRRGGSHAETLVARANVWSTAASLLAPVVIASLAATAVGGRAVALLPIAVLGILELRGGQVLESVSVTRPARLPASFWVAWLYVVLVVAIEFSYVVWGSTIVERRTGVSRELATGIVGAFVAGMLVGRLALAAGLARHWGARRWMQVGLLVAGAGGGIVWLSTEPALSTAGLLVAGAGTAGLYPLGIPAALARAPGAPLSAGARMTLASGVALLAAPLVLGVISDLFGIVAGWPLVIALCGAALLVLRAIPPVPGAASPAASPSS